jgi:urease accessory protein
MRRGVVLAALGVVATAVATPALAHTARGLPGGFGAGFAHPFGGPDHLLAMVSVGLWGAILGRPLVYALPVAFPLMMVVGAILAMFGVPAPPVEVGVAASALVLGACVALRLRAPVPLAIALVAGFALCHGYAHGRELPAAADPLGYSAGFVLATGLLHLAGVGIGAFGASPAGARVTRTLGALIAAAGVGFLAQALGG